MQGKITYEPIGFELLPEKFPFSALESLYMAILQRDLDRRNFRKKMLSFGIIKQLKEKQQNVPHKRGFLYSFDWKKYEQLQKRGMHFEL
ncbi:MAG: hypothetical protein MUF42_08555 [Cytophagaceae bacterium]|nr:hypothetical protein [Cytophagaceae bacterium]